MRLVPMAMIESVAVFRQRAEELQTGLQAKLEGQGLNTFRSLAFALGTPQAPPRAISMPSHCACWGQASRLRRGLLLGLYIFFEASTLVVASLKEQFSARVELGLIRVQKCPLLSRSERCDGVKRLHHKRGVEKAPRSIALSSIADGDDRERRRLAPKK